MNMKAMICKKFGSPEFLSIEELQKPLPADHEVLTKNHCTPPTPAEWCLDAMRNIDVCMEKVIDALIFSTQQVIASSANETQANISAVLDLAVVPFNSQAKMQ